MLIDFGRIVQDKYGHIEPPAIHLETLSFDYIMPVIGAYGLSGDIKYNDLSIITFQVPNRFMVGTTMIDNPVFDEIIGMRVIKLEGSINGRFIIKNPVIQEEDGYKIKNVTCESIESELQHRTVAAIEGTYQFYDPTGLNPDTILAIVMEKLPQWSIGRVDSSLIMRYRTFDQSSRNIYSFLTNDIQTSYQCLFEFDTINRIINVHDLHGKEAEVLPIYLSPQNVIINSQSTELSDEIVTCLHVYGADDVDITSVNPLATDYILNLDYWIIKGDIPGDLTTKWRSWQSNYGIYQRIFSNLYSQYYLDQNVYNTEQAHYVDLRGEYEAENNVLDTYKADVGGQHDIEAQERIVAEKLRLANAQKAVADAALIKVNANIEQMQFITEKCALSNNFTDAELVRLQTYFKEDNLQDPTFVLTNTSAAESIVLKINDSPIQFSITKGNLYRSNKFARLTPDEWAQLDLSISERAELEAIEDGLADTYLDHYFYKLDSGALSALGSGLDIQGSIANSTLSYKEDPNEDGSYDCTLTLYINHPTVDDEVDKYENGILVATGTLKDFTYSQAIGDDADTMSFKLNSGIFTLTYDSSIYQRQSTIQSLFEYGVDALNKLAFPAFEFAVDSANFLFLPEFNYYKNNFELGKCVYFERDDGYFVRPIFTEVHLNFEDPTDFSLSFSDKYRPNHPEYLLADIIGETSSTVSSLDSSKFKYSEFANSDIQNKVEKLITEELDVARNAIINSVGQDILIDSAGIHLRKLLDDGTFDPCQVRMVNNQIVFTDDNWDSAKLAIGKLSSGAYGIIADYLIGRFVVGENLIIEASGFDEATGIESIMHFKVDKNGATMSNGNLYIQGEQPTTGNPNQIMIDPDYGIIAGTKIFNFDATGSASPDDESLADIETIYGVKLPKTAKFWFDSKTGNLAFRGNIYAENGYFNGTINAQAGNIGNTKLNYTIDNVTYDIFAKDGNFWVKPDGTMSAMGGTFSGDVTCTNLTVTQDAVVTGLEVGTNITMGPNATISWNKVTDTGNVLEANDVGTTTDSYGNKITTIRGTSISTGSINANQITAGTISGDRIDAGTLHLQGNVYRGAGGGSGSENDNFLIGINNSSPARLQIGTASTNKGYSGSSIYTGGDLYIMVGTTDTGVNYANAGLYINASTKKGYVFGTEIGSGVAKFG